MLTSPVFIVTSGRSGSTLLSTLINASDQLFIPPESDFIARAHPYFQDRPSLEAADYELAVRLFKNTAQNRGWGMDGDYLRGELEAHAPQSFAQLNDAIYSAYLRSVGVGHGVWGIKCPVLIASVDRILDVFPDAKIVHLVRDGRDVYLSYRSLRRSGETWGPNGVIPTALYWVDGLRRIESVPEHSLIEVRYEDIVENPEAELTRLCDFMGISFRRQMLTNRHVTDPTRSIVLDEHRDTIHKKVFERLDRTNIGKYRSLTNKTDIWTFESLAGPYLQKYGYPCMYPACTRPLLHPIQKACYSLARQVNDWRYRRRDRMRLERAP